MTTNPELLSHHGTISLKIDLLHEDVSEMKSVLKELTIAINRLAVVEERQAQTSSALERVFGQLENITTRLGLLELQAVTSKQTSNWVSMTVWGAATAFVTVVLAKIWLLK